jgi:hypothetical protein
MTIATYADLRTAVGNWLERSDLTSVIPDFIALSRAKAFRGDATIGLEPLRIGPMITTGQIAITAGAGAMPARWLEFLSLRWTGQHGPQLRFLPAQSFWSYADSYEAPATPAYYTIQGNTVRVQTTDNTTVDAVYYVTFPPLSADTDEDWVLVNAPHVWLHGALMEAANFIADPERSAREAALFAGGVSALNRADRRARQSGAALQSIPTTVI